MVEQAELLRFEGPAVEGKDVYNPSAPFEHPGGRHLAGRVESRGSETDTAVYFFTEREDGVWVQDERIEPLPLQDPFVTPVAGGLVVGGVRYPVGDGEWETWFYRGRTPAELEHFATGPRGMKDIRPVGLGDGRIGVFTRPQGEIGGRGTIGWTVLDELDELDNADLVHAPLLEGMWPAERWGGVNEAQLLAPGKVGALGHIANFSGEDTPEPRKHYRAMAFVYDVEAGRPGPLQVIAQRTDFPAGEAKRSPELDDVLIPGGAVRRPDGRWDFWCGLSDVDCARAVLENPFA